MALTCATWAGRARFCRAAILVGLLLLRAGPAKEPASLQPPRSAAGPSEALTQILRENALFFNILTTFCFTAAFTHPAWGVDVRDINLNLVTRAVRDPRGNQIVRVRVAGVVRSNNNVELNILGPSGIRVGAGFFGFESGQLTFYDRNGRTIIDGFMDGYGNYQLSDFRLPNGDRHLARGFVLPCWYCDYLKYDWFGRGDFRVGGGNLIPIFYYNETDRIRMRWTFELGSLAPGVPAYGDADYMLTREVTGAINSVLFDTDRSAESFFSNPFAVVPPPAGLACLPRVSDETGVAVTNTSAREILVTYAARRYDGSLVTGDGIQNPVTYLFSAGRQYAAYPEEIFASVVGRPGRVFAPGEIGWLEISSEEGEIQTMYLEGDASGHALDGNVAVSSGSSGLVFPDVRIGPGESTSVTLLNLDFDSQSLRLQLLDSEGSLLAEEGAFFIAGRGLRTFDLGAGSAFLPVSAPERAAALLVACEGFTPAVPGTCGSLAGLATYRDGTGSLSTAYAASAETAAAVLLGAYFVEGPDTRGEWETTVRVAGVDGTPAEVRLDLYDSSGTLLGSARKSLGARGQASFSIGGEGLLPGRGLSSGYLRIESAGGRVAGDVTVSWTDDTESNTSTFPLTDHMVEGLQFNQVAVGRMGSIEYWTGIGLLNDGDTTAELLLSVYLPDGTVDRTAHIALAPHQGRAFLLSEVLADPGYARLGGYIGVSASVPITGVVFYGDAANRFLATVPALPQ